MGAVVNASPEQLAEWAALADDMQGLTWSPTAPGPRAAAAIRPLLADLAAALRERDELARGHHDLCQTIDSWEDTLQRVKAERDAALRERDELRRLLHVNEAVFDGDTRKAVAEIDALRVRAETAEADADRLAARPKFPSAAYRRWCQFGNENDARTLDEWERQNAAVDAAHAAAVEARHAD